MPIGEVFGAPPMDDRAAALQAIRAAGGAAYPDLEKLAAAGGDTRDLFAPHHEFINVQLNSVSGVARLLPKLAALPEVERLFLSQSDVADDDLKQLRSLPKLRALWLDQTRITDEGLPDLTALPQLATLSLDGTKVAGSGLKSLAALPDLQQLFLDRTPIENAGLAHLAPFPRLLDLGLGETNVGNEGLAHLSDCQGLQSIRLNATLVNDTGLAHLARLAKLCVLDIGDTGVGDEGLKRLGRFDHFSQLYLARTKVGDASAARIAQATGLRFLDLRGTILTDAGLAKLARLTDLRTLRLDGTKVTVAGLVHLAGMQRLEVLGLSGAAISDEGLAHLTPLAGLRHLDLSETRISADGLAKLHALPRLERIETDGTRVTPLDLLRILPRTTKSVRAILQALDERTEIDVRDLPLRDVFDYLSDKHGISIQFDRRSADKAGVNLGTSVTFSVAGVTLREALEAILKPLGLAMDVRHEVLLIGADPLPAIVVDLPLAAEGDTLAPKLAEVLGERTDVDFTDQPLSEVMAYLREKHDVVIRLDLQSLELVGVGTDTPVTRMVKGITLKSALELILNDLDLTCVPNGEEILIVSNRVGPRPLYQRWEIRYPDMTFDEYAQHLDDAGIELGIIGIGETKYVRNFSRPSPDVRTGKNRDERRLWLQWQKGELKEADRELLKRSGVAAASGLVVQFYSADLEKKLLALERDYRGRNILAIAKTSFGVRKRGTRLEFYVIDQTAR
ncbi:MAG TPA: hypothetical protein VJ783_12870 [Pirellulales bacterium]|nr:hypothetical protein [Pirellulales bacterium]